MPLAVLLLGDVADAGRPAALDVVVQARRAGAPPGLGPLAGAEEEDLAQQVERAAHALGARVGAEVRALAPVALAREVDAREVLVQRDRDVGVGLVVAQPDVEARLVLPDEVLLGEQRLRLGVHDDRLDVLDLVGGRARAVQRRVREVGRDALAQRLRLADVDHPPARARGTGRRRARREARDAARQSLLPILRSGVGAVAILLGGYEPSGRLQRKSGGSATKSLGVSAATRASPEGLTCSCAFRIHSSPRPPAGPRDVRARERGVPRRSQRAEPRRVRRYRLAAAQAQAHALHRAVGRAQAPRPGRRRRPVPAGRARRQAGHPADVHRSPRGASWTASTRRRRRAAPPSSTAYKQQFLAFKRQYPFIKSYSVWNEINHVSQPTSKSARARRRLLQRRPQLLQGRCKIMAADVLDQSNLVTYLRQFQRVANGIAAPVGPAQLQGRQPQPQHRPARDPAHGAR